MTTQKQETLDWKRLGEVIRARRLDLDLKQSDIPPRGGPSTVTLRYLEQGQQTAYRDITLRQVERALEWAPGSCAAILAGREPTTAPATTSPMRAATAERVLAALRVADNPGTITLSNPNARELLRELAQRDGVTEDSVVEAALIAYAEMRVR